MVLYGSSSPFSTVGVDDSSTNWLGSSVVRARLMNWGRPGFDPRSSYFFLFLQIQAPQPAVRFPAFQHERLRNRVYHTHPELSKYGSRTPFLIQGVLAKCSVVFVFRSKFVSEIDIRVTSRLKYSAQLCFAYRRRTTSAPLDAGF